MKTAQCRGCAAPLIALLLGVALNQTVCASNVTWNRIEVDAHLDNSGALHVRERMFVTVDGEMPLLERKIALFEIRYGLTAADNDVRLLAVPEPSSGALLLFALAVFGRRSRRARQLVGEPRRGFRIGREAAPRVS